MSTRTISDARGSRVDQYARAYLRAAAGRHARALAMLGAVLALAAGELVASARWRLARSSSAWRPAVRSVRRVTWAASGPRAQLAGATAAASAIGSRMSAWHGSPASRVIGPAADEGTAVGTVRAGADRTAGAHRLEGDRDRAEIRTAGVPIGPDFRTGRVPNRIPPLFGRTSSALGRQIFPRGNGQSQFRSGARAI